MRKKVLKAFMLVFLCLVISTLNAQETIVSSGGNASGDGGSVSYSIGQAVYSSYNGNEGSITEGVNHPFEIFINTAINELNGISLSVSAYPNPTTNFLTLKIDGFEYDRYSYYLYNLDGRLLDNKKIESSESNIDMSNYRPASYILKITKGNNKIKVFTITKN